MRQPTPPLRTSAYKGVPIVYSSIVACSSEKHARRAITVRLLRLESRITRISYLPCISCLYSCPSATLRLLLGLDNLLLLRMMRNTPKNKQNTSY